MIPFDKRKDSNEDLFTQPNQYLLIVLIQLTLAIILLFMCVVYVTWKIVLRKSTVAAVDNRTPLIELQNVPPIGN